MASKTIDRDTYRQVVQRLKDGQSRKQVQEDMQLTESTVGKISVHAGIAKPKSKEHADRDKAIVEQWLKNAVEAESRPAAPLAKKGTARTVREKREQSEATGEKLAKQALAKSRKKTARKRTAA
jgi:hypothetical protein